MEPTAKRQRTEEFNYVPTISLVWLDDSADDSGEIIATQQQLRTLDGNLKIFKNDNECENYIKAQFTNARIVLIIDQKLGQGLIPRVHDFPQIVSIYVFGFNNQLHETWAKDFPKVNNVLVQFNELKNRIGVDHFNQEPETFDEQPMTDVSETHRIQIQWTYDLDLQYFISDICMDYLSNTKSSSDDKDEFVLLCQSAFGGESQRMALLQEFQEIYSSNQALSWFSRDPFFFQIIENAFKLAHIETMYLCRFFIRDIQKQFQQYKCTSAIQVYNSELISNDILNELKNFVGKIIAIKSFVFATLDRTVALDFAPAQNDCKRVLFDIEANPEIEGVRPFVKIGSLCEQYDEHEILFMVGSLFKIVEIQDEVDGITNIKMTLCASENEGQLKPYIDSLKQLHILEFGEALYDIGHALHNEQIFYGSERYIRNRLDEVSLFYTTRIRCYDKLGNINVHKGDLDSALCWYKKSFAIKQEKLQPDDPNIAESYRNIAFVLLQKGDRTQALETFQHLLLILKQIYGDDHLHLIACYNNMINIYESEEKYSQVLSCYHQIYNIMLKHHPIDDINFAPICNNIGKTFANLNQYDLALGYYNTSLVIKLKTLPLIHDSTASTYKSIGVVCEYMNNGDQARIYYEKAADIYRQLYSSEHKNVLEIEELIQNTSSELD